MNEKRMDLCPRLIDYLVIVGSREMVVHPASEEGRLDSPVSLDIQGMFSNQTSTNRSELLRRYPSCSHEDFVLPSDVVSFCQPDSCTVSASPLPNMRHSTSFIFALTEKDSAKIRYGVSLNFLQRLSLRGQASGSSQDQASGRRQKIHRRVYSLVSLCIISHHPFFTKFRQLLNVLRRLIDCSNERIRCSSSAVSHFSDGVWEALLGVWLENISAAVMKEVCELETWILKLLSAPVPAPGFSKLHLKVLPTELHEPVVFALPNHVRFSLADFPVYLLFELLGPEAAFTVILCILLEQKVVMQSRDYNAVSICVLASICLLYPLEYLFPVIPLLPPCFKGAEQLLLAPTPFVIGVPASFFEMRPFPVLPTDIVLVDLDSSKVTMPSGTSVPSVPEADWNNLLARFSEALKLMTPNGEETDQAENSSFDGNDDKDPDLTDLRIRISMVRFFDSPNILGNFAEHIRVMRLYPRPVVALLRDSVYKSRPLPSAFVKELLQTQAVEYFSECSLLPKNEAYIRVQNGIDDPYIIGDKVKWYDEDLMVNEFDVISPDSTLSDAWSMHESAIAKREAGFRSDEEEDSSSSSSLSSVSDLVFESPECEFYDSQGIPYSDGPLGEVEHVYSEPLRLEVPGLDNVFSNPNSAPSSVISSASSVSTCNVDSENDFARLAQNLALKTNLDLTMGDVREKASTEEISCPEDLRLAANSADEPLVPSPEAEASIEQPRRKSSTKFPWISSFNLDNGDGHAKGNLLSALKTQTVWNEVLKTVPNVRSKDVKDQRPSIASNAGAEDKSDRKFSVQRKISPGNRSQPNRNQQTVKEICDAVLAGQGAGVFALHKFRKLMEDENLRVMAARRLHQRRGTSESLADEYVDDVFVPRNVAKGMVRLLQAAIHGLEVSFQSVVPTCLASVMQILEIAHTHYWVRDLDVGPMPKQSYSASVHSSKSGSMSDLSQAESLPVDVGRPFPEVSAPLVVTSHDHLHSTNVPLQSAANSTRSDVPSPPSRRNRQQPPMNDRGAKLDGRSESNVLSLATSSFRESNDNLASACYKDRVYLYEELLGTQQRHLWNNVQFWENVFYDAVAQEREIVGMDLEPRDLVHRYECMSGGDKKRLELEEDKLLATILHNLCALMVLTNCPKRAILQKVRRLLGKTHTGLLYSQEINVLLDNVPYVSGNGIRLKVCGYQQLKKHSFTVHAGPDIFGDMMFMEISDDAVILRGINGSLVERWWFEQLVNMTYSPKTKVVCLWRRNGEGKVSLSKYYCKKCRSLYTYAKSAMEKAAAKGKVSLPGKELCGEFSIQDIETKLTGTLHIQINGLVISFGNDEWFIHLASIKKCNTSGGNIFILEFLDQYTDQLIQRKYFSHMASEIGRAVHRMISVVYYSQCL
uniref:MAP kinase-activating death domain protein n=1 Tax=Trichuris muris TaxID=70415 RepID=A0A5S6Q1S7_TRIMR